MFINKTKSGTNNICGEKIAAFRKAAGISQNRLAVLLQIRGLDVDKNAIQRIEAGKRFVTDIELVYFTEILSVTYEALLDRSQVPLVPTEDIE
jgi:transcriptional regulator with XRE-family HTH domain